MGTIGLSPDHLAARRVVVACAAMMMTLAGLLLAFPGAAHAQDNSLNEIVPANGAALLEAPTEITLSFNQPVESDQFVQVVLSCNGTNLVLGQGEFSDDEAAVTFPIVSEVPSGVCIIDWDLFNEDDASVVASDRSNFSVDTAVAAATTAPPGDPALAESTPATSVGGPAPAATTTVPSQQIDTSTPVVDEPEGSNGGAIWLGRLISTLGIMVLFGALVVISTGWPEGPEYAVTLSFFRLVWIVTLIGTLLYVVAYAADFADAGLAGGLNPLTWIDLLNDGWTGVGAVLRIVAVIASYYVAMQPERIIDPAVAMWAWLIPGVAVLAVAFSRVSGPAALIGLLIAVAHVFAAAIWFGGTALLARVVLAGPGEEDLVVATRVFSRYSVAAIALTILTGVIETIRLVGGELFSSGHGRVLLLKILFVAAMLFVGMSVRQQAGERLRNEYDMSVNNADRLRRAFSAEAVIGVIVLGLSSWLLALDPGTAEPWADESYTREIPFVVPALDLDATVKVGPSRVGQNGFLIQVESPPEGITQLTLRFIPPAGTQNGQAWVVQQDIPLTGSGSAWRPLANGIPLDVPGTWRLELSATTAAGVEPGALMTFRVDNPDGSEPTVASTVATVSTVPTNTQVIDQAPATGEVAEQTTTTTATTAAP